LREEQRQKREEDRLARKKEKEDAKIKK